MDLHLEGKCAVVTGGGGAIGGEIVRALAAEGVSVAVWDINLSAAQGRADEIVKSGGSAKAVACDVTDPESVQAAADSTGSLFPRIDILVTAAGGSRPEATTSDAQSFFELLPESMSGTVSLNYLSAVYCAQEVGRMFADNKSGTIINITSIAGILPLTRAVSYSDGKAALNSFTRWLAVHMAKTYSPQIRVNAVAPGFILTDQNRFLLVDGETGEITERGKSILEHVPAARYGKPAEVAGAVLWLTSDQASFVTGSVITVDGGYSAFSGV